MILSLLCLCTSYYVDYVLRFEILLYSVASLLLPVFEFSGKQPASRFSPVPEAETEDRSSVYTERLEISESKVADGLPLHIYVLL